MTNGLYARAVLTGILVVSVVIVWGLHWLHEQTHKNDNDHAEN